MSVESSVFELQEQFDICFAPHFDDGINPPGWAQRNGFLVRIVSQETALRNAISIFIHELLLNPHAIWTEMELGASVWRDVFIELGRAYPPQRRNEREMIYHRMAILIPRELQRAYKRQKTKDKERAKRASKGKSRRPRILVHDDERPVHNERPVHDERPVHNEREKCLDSPPMSPSAPPPSPSSCCEIAPLIPSVFALLVLRDYKDDGEFYDVLKASKTNRGWGLQPCAFCGAIRVISRDSPPVLMRDCGHVLCGSTRCFLHEQNERRCCLICSGAIRKSNWRIEFPEFPQEESTRAVFIDMRMDIPEEVIAACARHFS